jgi:protein-S-isoprenylcysteine O-methyltransferase Ste14
MYLGMIVALGGLAIFMNSAYAWFVVAAFAVIIRTAFVRREEALMLQTFGDAYRQYQQQTRRWI